MRIAVLTGDIVGSSKIDSNMKSALADVLEGDFSEGLLWGLRDDPELMAREVYRGDSFQIAIRRPELSLFTAMIVMLGLRVNGSRVGIRIDSRVGIGIGEVEYQDVNRPLGLWSGEAFELSGKSLLDISLVSRNRIRLRTTWGGDLDVGINAAMGLLDFAIARWTDKECQALLAAFQFGQQKRIGEHLGISQSSVSQRLHGGAWWAIRDYEKDFRRQIQNMTNQDEEAGL